MKAKFKILLLIPLLFSCNSQHSTFFSEAEHPSLSDDGAWSWFSDPRAIYYHDDNGIQVVSGWVKSDGSVEAGSVNLKTGEIASKVLYKELQRDDHNNPAFVETSEGQLLAQYTMHGQGDVYQHVTTIKGDITSFSDASAVDVIGATELEKFPKRTVTYANPLRLEDEDNKLFSFGRWTGYKPNIMWSKDNGETWTKSRVFIINEPFQFGNRPYVKYFSDGKSKIHMTFTDGHPRNEPTNAVYYAYYEAGAFYRADGGLIATLDELPFDPSQASTVYQPTEESGKSWVFDIAVGEDDQPVILYTRYPSDEDHRYHYAKLVDGVWVDTEIVASGNWFPQTPEGQIEIEPNYSGGLTVHPKKTNTVYLSRKIDGIFEIEKRITNNDGLNWDVFPITQHSQHDNVRPFVPRNYADGDPDVVLWMENERYNSYTDYDVNIRYMVDD